MLATTLGLDFIPQDWAREGSYRYSKQIVRTQNVTQPP